jgi:Flp pilus assembly protein TadG
MKRGNKKHRRLGVIAVLIAILMVMMFAMVAFSYDLGYFALVRTEAQTAADAGALAAAEELLISRTLTPTTNPNTTLSRAREAAKTYVRANPLGTVRAELAGDDVVFGRVNLGAGSTTAVATPGNYNAVQVRVRRSAEINGEVPTFFARVLGITSGAIQAQATAAFADNIVGFNEPTEGKKLYILPFAIDKQTWDELVELGRGTDVWKWDEVNQRVVAGPDGILEVNLYPHETGMPGNRGTIDLGNPNNSTRDIVRQITDGLNAYDLSYLGGKLELGSNGTLSINGDTGLSAGMQNALESICGKPRIVSIYSTCSGNGNQSQYTIVGFAGIRVMDVNLHGSMSSKRVIIQPANTITGGIPGDDSAQTSTNIYSPVWLVQ